MTNRDDLATAAEKLIDAINQDVNGKPGMPFSGNGGLVSNETIRAADEARILISKLRSEQPHKRGDHVRIEHDGFEGTLLDPYTTLEGKPGWTVQLDGARVVHVYGEKWLKDGHHE